MQKIGIIGGSGLDDPNLLKEYREIEVTTPFGKPSSPLTLGKIAGTDVVIIARHGKKHSIMPSKVPYQANIWALKEQGCTHILATSACGSLREEIEPGHILFPDQFIDRTTSRHSTFHMQDRVCHIPMADPFCVKLRAALLHEAKALGLMVHPVGTVITIEGPRFSTRAESKMFRQWGADVINMSTVPEVALAREAGMCYQVICMSTDYDSWHESKESVTIEMVLSTMKKNADNVKRLLVNTIPKISHIECECMEHAKNALI